MRSTCMPAPFLFCTSFSHKRFCKKRSNFPESKSPCNSTLTVPTVCKDETSCLNVDNKHCSFHALFVAK